MTSRQATSEYARRAGSAVGKVTLAVKSGRLVKPAACSECGGPGPIQGHHHNGYGPGHELDVVWLCRPCHLTRHGKRAIVPTWERHPRAYQQATGRLTGRHWRYHSFGAWSMPKHLLKTMRYLWAALRTDEERAAMLALVQELAATEEEAAS